MSSQQPSPFWGNLRTSFNILGITSFIIFSFSRAIYRWPDRLIPFCTGTEIFYCFPPCLLKVSSVKFLFLLLKFNTVSVPVAARSKAWVCGRLLAGIAGSNPAGFWSVLSDRGLCVALITRAEESCRVWCVWVWSWSLDYEEALAH